LKNGEKMKKVLLFAGVSILILTLSGCMSYTGGVAPSNVPLEGKTYSKLGKSQGADNTWYLFGVLPLGTSASTEVALNRAIRKKDGDAMINITSDGYNYNYIVLGRHKTVVRGTVIKFNEPTDIHTPTE
jgi:hypothetical protein